MKGVLIYYFATGEHGRLQFIGNNSMDESGKVCNYKEVYDVKLKDKINGCSLNKSVINSLAISCSMLGELPAVFMPDKDSKSWEDLIK